MALAPRLKLLAVDRAEVALAQAVLGIEHDRERDQAARIAQAGRRIALGEQRHESRAEVELGEKGLHRLGIIQGDREYGHA